MTVMFSWIRSLGPGLSFIRKLYTFSRIEKKNNLAKKYIKFDMDKNQNPSPPPLQWHYKYILANRFLVRLPPPGRAYVPIYEVFCGWHPLVVTFTCSLRASINLITNKYKQIRQ